MESLNLYLMNAYYSQGCIFNIHLSSIHYVPGTAVRHFTYNTGPNKHFPM